MTTPSPAFSLKVFPILVALGCQYSQFIVVCRCCAMCGQLPSCRLTLYFTEESAPSGLT